MTDRTTPAQRPASGRIADRPTQFSWTSIRSWRSDPHL